MKITEDQKNGTLISRIEGEININSSPDLRKAFDGYIRRKIGKIVVDFSQVTYVDSSGLATLVELFQRLKKINGKLRICSLSQKVKNVFEITRLAGLFQIYNTADEAVKDF